MTNRFLTILLTGDIKDTITGELIQGSNIAKTMNELYKENEQLQQDIENLKITIKARETLIDVCEKKFKELGYIITVDDDGYVIE